MTRRRNPLTLAQAEARLAQLERGILDYERAVLRQYGPYEAHAYTLAQQLEEPTVFFRMRLNELAGKHGVAWANERFRDAPAARAAAALAEERATLGPVLYDLRKAAGLDPSTGQPKAGARNAVEGVSEVEAKEALLPTAQFRSNCPNPDILSDDGTIEHAVCRWKRPRDAWHHLRYFVDGRAVSALTLRQTTFPTRGRAKATIDLVYTDPAYRGKGYAAALLREARDYFSEVKHSSDLTAAGAAWKARVGNPRRRKPDEPVRIRLVGFGKPRAIKPEVEAFLRDLFDASYPNPLGGSTPTERILSGIEVLVDVVPEHNGIHIDRLRALTRKQGEGTKAMRFLTSLADRHGVKLSLYAKPFGSEAMNRDTLVNFYRRFGFYPDEAEEEDEGTEMYRWPRAPLRANPDASSAAFRRWFGASKVVDKRGKPLVVYHGAARSGFDTFRKQARRGIFFSDIPEVAWTYTRSDADALATRTATDRRKGKSALYEVYLRMEKPLVVDAMGSDWASVPVYGMPEAQREAVLNAVYPYASALSTDDLVAAARKLKYDGVIIKNVVDIGDYTDYDGTSTVYAVFDPKQVKSANMNAGTFDPDDPSILRNPASRNPSRKAKHVYHLTYASDLPFIARQGLVPRADTEAAWDNEPGIYFVNVFGYEAGAPESEEPAWLRFPAPEGLPPKFFTGMNEAHANVVFPASSIDVWVDVRGRPVSKSDKGRWKPLVEVVRPRANPAPKAKPPTLAAASLPEVWFHGTQKTFGKLKAQGGACIWLADKAGAMAYATPHYGRRSAIRLIEVTLAPDTRVVDLADASDPAVRAFIHLDASERNMRWHGREDVTDAEMADAVARWNARRTHYDAIEARSWAKAHFRKAGADALLVRDVAGWGGHETMPSLCLLNPKKVLGERDVAPDLALVRAENMPKYENPRPVTARRKVTR